MAFLALYNDLHSFISAGALLHALVASFMNVEIALSEVHSLISFPLDVIIFF